METNIVFVPNELTFLLHDGYKKKKFEKKNFKMKKKCKFKASSKTDAKKMSSPFGELRMPDVTPSAVSSPYGKNVLKLTLSKSL